ncbi:MAG: ABC transporter permease [Bacteroidaceae bacterium]|nr:ABC transporter permease [Bacteroidaceae bacterium]
MKTITYAIRIITRMKAYSIICILGLVISMAGTLTLVRYIHQELTVDHYLKDLDKLHLLTTYIPSENINRLSNNRNWNRESHFVDPLDHPSVESYTKITVLLRGEVIKDNYHFPVRAIAADTLFFQLLPRETVIGTTKDLPPTGAILTEELANRLYGKADPIGQTLTFGGKNVTVYGVVKAPKTKSSLNYDIVLSANLQREWVGLGNAAQFCLARLHHADDLAALNEWQPIQKLISYNKQETQFRLVPYKDFYMDADLKLYQGEEMCPKGDRNGIRILIFVAGLLFFIGVLNYLNLYTVIMQKRGLEFGVKKVFGAGRWAFFKQLYMENFLLSAITFLFVGMIIEVTDKILVSGLGIPLYRNASFDTALGLIMLFGFPLLTMLYPYFRHVYSRPVSSMQGIKQGGGSPITRSIFLSVQYVISFCLIVVSIYFAKQLNAMLNADLGFHTQDIIRCTLVPAKNRDVVIKDMNAWEREREKDKQNAAHITHTLNSCPSIIAWSGGDQVWNMESTPYPIAKKADTEGEFTSGVISWLSTADIRLFQLPIVEGRGWDDSIDKFTNYRLLINESAKKALGITDIRTDQIQTQSRLWWSADEDCSGNPPFQIVGVVKDFRNSHLSQASVPTIYIYHESSGEYIHPGTPFIIRYQPGKQQEVLKLLSDLRNEVSGEGELEYSFLEDEIAKRYENDRRIVRIYLVFAGLAIAVSCLGLFGLSLFEIRLRYREIALRKVHGAGVCDITRLLLKRYLLLLGVSAVIAFPISIFFIQKYMEDYAYRTPLSWWIFVVALLVIAVISAGVLFWQIRKAANINPAKIMKSE